MDDQPTEDTLITEVRGLRGDVRTLNQTVADERRGRKITSRLAAALLIVLLALGVNWIRDGRTTCSEKLQRADIADQRVLIAVDQLAGTKYVKMPAGDRQDLTADLGQKLDQLPPPC